MPISVTVKAIYNVFVMLLPYAETSPILNTSIMEMSIPYAMIIWTKSTQLRQFLTASWF